MTDEAWMNRAIAVAEKAAETGEVPVGAVIVLENQLVAEAANRREVDQDPTAHAEIIAIRAAARTLGRWRLSGATLYVTLEPCPMCAGALVNARIDRLVYGAADPKAGAVRTLYEIADDPRLNHRMQVEGGVRAEACGGLLSRFFAARRSQRNRGD